LESVRWVRVVIYNQTGIKEAFIEKRALSTLLNGQLLKVVAYLHLAGLHNVFFVLLINVAPCRYQGV
jgi:hypothetical protein